MCAAYSLDQKVKIHGVIRKSQRGVPPSVFQNDKVTPKQAEQRRGTVKAAVLTGDSKSCDLVVASCFDQKPFYMISHSIPEITWVECIKPIWSRSLMKNVDYKFLRWNLSDDYNFEINDNDVADQLRLVYRMQRFHRNYKWWWSLWVWGMEITIVNAYMMYRRYCELKEVPQLIDHHDFREKLAYALLDPANEWPKRKSGNGNKKRTRTPTLTPEPAKKRAPRMNTDALSPNKGRLKKRLDRSLSHMPQMCTNNKKHRVCQLHHWASSQTTGGDTEDAIPAGARANVVECKACDVKLCILCFSIYHEKMHLEGHIDSILGED